MTVDEHAVIDRLPLVELRRLAHHQLNCIRDLEQQLQALKRPKTKKGAA